MDSSKRCDLKKNPRNIAKYEPDWSIHIWTFCDKVDYTAIADFAFLKIC